MKTLINIPLIALCCAALILAGCKAEPAPLDPYLVGTENCSPPCWNGILPGQTNQDTAVRMMLQVNDENGGHLSVNNFGISWQEKVTKRVYGIDFEDDLVKIIRFQMNRASLEQVIGLFGEPEYWISGAGKGERYILIYYPDKGLAFAGSPGRQKTITRDASVTYSYFVSSTDIRNEIGIIHGEGWIDEFMTKIHEWKGYGDVIPQN